MVAGRSQTFPGPRVPRSSALGAWRAWYRIILQSSWPYSTPRIESLPMDFRQAVARGRCLGSHRTLFGNVGRLPRVLAAGGVAGSCPGGHVSGQDVVGVAVEVVAGPVIPHRGTRVGVSGSDLHVAQVGAGVEHGRDVGMAEHVRVCPGGLDAGGFGEVP